MITPKQKKINQQRDILFILISSFIVVAAWISFNIYHIYITSTISQNLQLQLLPINPNFDANTIQQLRTRENVAGQFTMQQQQQQQTGSGSAEVGTTGPTPTNAPLQQPSSIQSLRTTPSYSPINRQGQ